MSLKYKNNGTTSEKLTAVIFNNGTSTNLNEIIKDGSYIWCKPFTYTKGTLPTGIASLTCYRISANEPDATIGEVPDGGTVYYGDKLKFTATFEDGYVVEDYQYSSSGDSAYTVTGDVNAVVVTQVHTGGRLTWSLTVKKRENMASVSYKKNNESAVNVTSDVTLTLDYADTVVVSGVAESEAPYNYTNMVGTGTYSYSSSAQTARVSVTRSVKSYVLTVSASGTSYLSSYSVSRTSSPYAGAATGTLSNNATIYYGDKLSVSASAAATRYGSWDCTSSDIPAPTGSWNGGATLSPSITLTAQGVGANIYHRTGGGDWVHLGWIDTNSSFTDSGLAFNTSYEYILGRNQSRRYWTRSASASLSSNYTSNDEVRGNVTATFTGSESSAQTQTQWINGTTRTISTGSIASYTFYYNVTGDYNGSYCGYYVERTSSPGAGAGTGTLSNGHTIYYGDVLVAHSWGGNSSWSYDNPTVATPGITGNWNGVVTLHNNDSSTVDIYRNTSNSAGGTNLGTVSGGGDKYDSPSADGTYYYSAGKTVTVTGHRDEYSVSSAYGGTNCVSGNVTATFSFSKWVNWTSYNEYRYSGTASCNYTIPTVTLPNPQYSTRWDGDNLIVTFKNTANFAVDADLYWYEENDTGTSIEVNEKNVRIAAKSSVSYTLWNLTDWVTAWGECEITFYQVNKHDNNKYKYEDW